MKNRNDIEKINWAYPDGYLQNFTPQLMEQIKAEEFLETLPKANVYTMPVNYFTNWKVNIPTQKKQYIYYSILAYSSYTTKQYTVLSIPACSSCTITQYTSLFRPPVQTQ